MKNILLIATLCLGLFSNIKAQPSWPSGAMSVANATATTLVPAYSVVPTNLSYMLNLTVDTGLVVTFVNTYKVKAGALAYVKVTNNTDAATHTVSAGTNCKMASFALTSAKIHLLTYVYDGTDFICINARLIN